LNLAVVSTTSLPDRDYLCRTAGVVGDGVLAILDGCLPIQARESFASFVDLIKCFEKMRLVMGFTSTNLCAEICPMVDTADVCCDIQFSHLIKRSIRCLQYLSFFVLIYRKLFILFFWGKLHQNWLFLLMRSSLLCTLTP